VHESAPSDCCGQGSEANAASGHAQVNPTADASPRSCHATVVDQKRRPWDKMFADPSENDYQAVRRSAVWLHRQLAPSASSFNLIIAFRCTNSSRGVCPSRIG
jgi:hypothetical protein